MAFLGKSEARNQGNEEEMTRKDGLYKKDEDTQLPGNAARKDVKHQQHLQSGYGEHGERLSLLGHPFMN